MPAIRIVNQLHLWSRTSTLTFARAADHDTVAAAAPGKAKSAHAANLANAMSMVSTIQNTGFKARELEGEYFDASVLKPRAGETIERR